MRLTKRQKPRNTHIKKNPTHPSQISCNFGWLHVSLVGPTTSHVPSGWISCFVITVSFGFRGFQFSLEPWAAHWFPRRLFLAALLHGFNHVCALCLLVVMFFTKQSTFKMKETGENHATCTTEMGNRNKEEMRSWCFFRHLVSTSVLHRPVVDRDPFRCHQRFTQPAMFIVSAAIFIVARTWLQMDLAPGLPPLNVGPSPKGENCKFQLCNWGSLTLRLSKKNGDRTIENTEKKEKLLNAQRRRHYALSHVHFYDYTISFTIVAWVETQSDWPEIALRSWGRPRRDLTSRRLLNLPNTWGDRMLVLPFPRT